MRGRGGSIGEQDEGVSLSLKARKIISFHGSILSVEHRASSLSDKRTPMRPDYYLHGTLINIRHALNSADRPQVVLEQQLLMQSLRNRDLRTVQYHVVVLAGRYAQLMEQTRGMHVSEGRNS